LKVAANVIFIFCQLLSTVLIVRTVMSLMSQDKSKPQKGFVFLLTEPILIPLRYITPKSARTDYSPYAAIALLQIISFVVYQTLILN
jgi:uncharacterized protein YggT (Ycf19 family)